MTNKTIVVIQKDTISKSQ